MKMLIAIAVLLPALALAQTPARVGYQGRILKADGNPEAGVLTLSFGLFSAATGGSALWSEEQSVGLSEGFYSVFLGDAKPFPPVAFDGGERFMEVAVGGQALTPRQRLTSVPYALLASSVKGGTIDAASIAVDGKTVIDSGGKLAGSALTTSPGSGLSVGGAGGLSLTTACVTGQILKWSGTTWECAADGGNTYTAGSGLELASGRFSLITACATGQILKWSGTTWECMADGGNTYTAGSGLELASGRFSLLTTCGSGQALLWDGSAWRCGQPGASYTATGGGLTLTGTAFSLRSCAAGQILKFDGALWICADANAGTVTAVTATAPLASTGGPAPTLSLPKATATADGFLAKEDFSVFSRPPVQVVSSRPANPAAGTLVFNSRSATLEVYDGFRWRMMSSRMDGELPGLLIYYDAADALSDPGTGTTWFDLTGNGVHATMVNGLARGTLGGVQTMVFDGAGAGAQFPNDSLNTQAFTAVYWVWSRLTTTNNNQGGLYVNRSDTGVNDANWVWFGKYADDIWYFRVNNGPCCQDLPGSGSTSWSARVPSSTWRMIHFGYNVGEPGGWKWGVNGLTLHASTLPGRPSSQNHATSTIGYGHSGAGSFWNGGIAATRFYSRLLSDAELAAEFNRLRTRYGQ